MSRGVQQMNPSSSLRSKSTGSNKKVQPKKLVIKNFGEFICLFERFFSSFNQIFTNSPDFKLQLLSLNNEYRYFNSFTSSNFYK